MLFYGLKNNDIIFVKLKYKLFKGYCVYFPTENAFSCYPDTNKPMYTKREIWIRTLIKLGYKPIKNIYDINLQIEYTDGTVSHIKFMEG